MANMFTWFKDKNEKKYNEMEETDGKNWKKKPKTKSDHVITWAFMTLLFIAIVGGIILLIVTLSYDWWWKYIVTDGGRYWCN